MRREEIEATLTTRVHAIAEFSEAADPDYVEALGEAVATALEFGLEAIGSPRRQEPQIPLVLLAQARFAARKGIGLDTVLRRYFAGYSLLGYLVVEEAGAGGLMGNEELKRLLGALAGVFDRLIAAVTEEHRRESEGAVASSVEREAERIERLLAGELVDTGGVAYDFSGWHLGLVATETCSEQRLRKLGRALSLDVLASRSRADAKLWAWLGGRQRLESAAARCELHRISDEGDERGQVAIGEPGSGLAGWRRTHRQAAAAMALAAAGPTSTVLYADVACLAAVLRDDVLTNFLRARILTPLQQERDQGAVAKETLRAYLAAGQQASSAAAALGVQRHTVTRRLRIIEQRIGQPIVDCPTEADLALKLDAHEALASPKTT